MNPIAEPSSPTSSMRLKMLPAAVMPSQSLGAAAMLAKAFSLLVPRFHVPSRMSRSPARPRVSRYVSSPSIALMWSAPWTGLLLAPTKEGKLLPPFCRLRRTEIMFLATPSSSWSVMAAILAYLGSRSMARRVPRLA